MRISRNENYSCWVHKIFEHVQNFRTDLLKLHEREEHCSNWFSLSLSLPEWTRMTRNDPPNKLEWSNSARSAVHSAQWDLGITCSKHATHITMTTSGQIMPWSILTPPIPRREVQTSLSLPRGVYILWSLHMFADHIP